MSHISVRGEQSSENEIDLLSQLDSLPTSASKAITKPTSSTLSSIDVGQSLASVSQLVGNSAGSADTVVFSMTIPANTISTGSPGALYARLDFGTGLGTNNRRIYIKLNGQTCYDSANFTTAISTSIIDGYIFCDSATQARVAFYRVNTSTGISVFSNSGALVTGLDWTSAQTLEVIIQGVTAGSDIISRSVLFRAV